MNVRPTSERPEPSIRRSLLIASTIAAAVGLMAFLQDVSERWRRPQEASAETILQAELVPTAVSYSELPNETMSPNAGWESHLDRLKFDPPGLFDTVHRSEDMKRESLASRSRTRAYEGAPPVIPHAVDQQTTNNCLSCHGRGTVIGGLVATKISHPPFANCTQCHVAGRAALPGEIPIAATNTFTGIERFGAGDRAYPGAPPTIPHPTAFREDCLSCHGLIARPGLRTTHPWLNNCVQCHAASSGVEWK